jgi:peptidoglycan-N-acetylglucosamine deacetylase
MSSHVRVHWDRVFVLLAAVTVLFVLVGQAIFRVVDTSHADNTPIEPEQVAAPPARICPPPAPRPLHTTAGGGDQRTVALTFDDGPGPWTDEVLQVLARENVKASFFVIGGLAARNSEQVLRIHAAGHAVENHSWSHQAPNPRRGWTTRSVHTEISRTNAVISSVTGQPPCYFRPPEGIVKGAQDEARAAGLTIALWSVDTRDWADQGPSAAALIRSRARLGLTQQHPIVLMHDGGGDRGATLVALPGVIDDYRRHGYIFVTLDAGRA